MTRMMRMVATQGEEVHDDEDEEHEVEDDPMQGMSSYLPISPCMSLSTMRMSQHARVSRNSISLYVTRAPYIGSPYHSISVHPCACEISKWRE